MALIFAAAIAAAPSPTPSPAPDSCTGSDGHTAVLSALNRPTVGFSPCSVKKGEALLELGYQRSLGDSAQAQTGQGFLRFGVTPSIEVDAIGPAYVQQFAPFSASGFADAGAGLKWQFLRAANDAAGIDVLLTVPSGAAAFTAGKPTQTINLDYSHSMGKFGVSTTIGGLHSNGYSSLLPSLAFSNQYNDRTQLYAEVFGQTKTGPGAGGLVGEDGGIQYLLTPQLEFDAEVGNVNSSGLRSRYYGFGLGIRL